MTSDATDLKIGLVSGIDARQVAAMEAAGIDSLWIGGHIASRNPSPEVMMVLARLAALTERVRVGTSVLLLPLYPPALVAKQVADLDRLTDGRVMLGVGVGGEYPQEFRAVQVPIEERGRRADEAIPLLRRFWTAEPVTHHGRYYNVDDVRIHPAPAQPNGPPILIAGRKEAAMRRAARLGDGWFPYLYSPRRYAASVEQITKFASDAGRSLDGFQWLVWVFVNVNADGEIARTEAAQSIGGTYNQDVRAMVDAVAAAGTPDEVTFKLQTFYDAGARHFVFCPAAPASGVKTTMGFLHREVIPALREHAAG